MGKCDDATLIINKVCNSYIKGSIYLSVHLFVHPSIPLSVCLPVCLAGWMSTERDGREPSCGKCILRLVEFIC